MVNSYHTIRYILTLFIFQYVSLYANDSKITGRVTDPSGMPIPYVQAYFKEEGVGTTTDRNGQFILNLNNRRGKILLIKHSAYHYQAVALDTSQKEILSITLVPKTYYFDPVTVEGNLYAQERLQLPVSHRLVRIDESVNWGNSVGERLDRLGIQIKDYGGPAGLKTAASPTGHSEHILIMIESLPLNSPQNGGFDFSYLPADLFAQGEFYLGHGSSLYGSSAMGGVLNLMVNHHQPSFVRIKSGSFGEKGMSGKTVMSFGPAQAAIFGSQYESLGDFRQNNDFKQRAYSGEISLSIGKMWKIDTFTMKSTIDRGISGSLQFLSPHARKDNDDILFITSLNGLSRWGQSEIILGYTGSDEHFIDPDFFINSKHQVTSHRFRAVHRFPKIKSIQNTFILELARNHVNSDDAGNHREFLGATGLLTQIRLFSNVHLSPSIRTDWSDIQNTSVTTGSFAILWRPESRFLWSLSMNMGTSYRNPTFNDLFWQDPWGYTAGNPRLIPEKGISEEIAAELHPLISQLLRIRVRGYHFFNRNLIQWIPDTNWVYSPENLTKTESFGSEMNVTISPDALPFQLVLGTEQNVSRVLSQTEDYRKRLLYVPGVSYWGEITCRMWFVNLNLSYRYLGRRRYSYGEEAILAPYDRLDVALSFRTPRFLGIEMVLDIGARNLQDRKGQQSVYGYPEPGRSLFSRLSFEFP